MKMKFIWIRNCFGIVLGAVITALALNMFLIPHKIAAGGTSGLSTIIHHTLGWPVGLTMLAFEIPLFLIGLKILGRQFGLNTLFGATALAVSIDLMAPYTKPLSGDLLLNALYGGILSGLGMSLVFRFKGSTAGTDIVAAIINKLFRISLGRALFGADFFVVFMAGIVFASPELCLYAFVALFVMTQIIDFVQEGPTSAKAFFVITECPDKIAESIMEKLARGVTFLSGRGAYTQKEREVIFCVVGTREVSELKEIIYLADRKAFVIVADAREVLGEGFGAYSRSS
jgi:uncharacterized membrane-anchored protein YitT (DUF2179 family)